MYLYSLTISVYVFFGEGDAMIDFIREMYYMNMTSGDYVVIAVDEKPYNPDKVDNYLLKCELSRSPSNSSDQ